MTRARTMPDPGDVALLGTLLELQHDAHDGQAHRHSWTLRTAPRLFWSPSRSALYAFPSLRLPRPRKLDPKATSIDTFEIWTGRAPSNTRTVDIPRPKIRRAGQAHFVVYRSDKWGKPTNYVHDFAQGTLVDLADGEPPEVLIVRGPPLQLTSAGLVH